MKLDDKYTYYFIDSQGNEHPAVCNMALMEWIK
jgi:hypothetical protein